MATAMMSARFVFRCFVVLAVQTALGLVDRSGLVASVQRETRANATFAAVFPETLICNAYSWPTPLEISTDDGQEQITKDGPLQYGECRHFSDLEIGAKDHFRFATDGQALGSFVATKLPEATPLLALLAFRKDELSSAIAFQSHFFSPDPGEDAQLAAIDLYRGDAFGALRIAPDEEKAEGEEPVNSLNAPFVKVNSVTLVSPGRYRIWLVGENLEDITSEVIKLEAKKTYVVLRIGNSNAGLPEQDQVKQQLVVYPKPEEPEHDGHKKGASALLRPHFFVFCAVAVAAAFRVLAGEGFLMM